MKKYLFCSYPFFSDNAFSVFNKMIDLNIAGEYIWLCKNKQEVNEGEKWIHKKKITLPQIKFFKKNSMRGVLAYITSNFIFYTHGMFEQFPVFPWQKKINLWHGMPLKKIGKLSDSNVRFKMSCTLSNGIVFNRPIKICFGINDEQLITMGSPRNDVFFESRDFDFYNIFKNRNKTIIWMTTFRKNIFSDEFNGRFENGYLSFLSYKQFKSLDSFLENHEMNLFIKLHPMDSLNNDESLLLINRHCKNIRIATNNNGMLKDNMYVILPSSYALITDYSSIYFDYLLLEKPIGLINYDKEEYKQNRGFIGEVASQMDGFIINNYGTLCDFISSLTDENEIRVLKKIAKQQRKVFQTYDESPNNTEKLLEILNIR